MLTPSSNTVLEPITGAMLAGVPGVSAHFSRFPVTEISLDGRALGQFQDEPMLRAARLLADARVDAICWNGTSAGWLGLDRDRSLCAAIAAEINAPATSSVLALAEIFRLTGVKRFGLVTPYLGEVQERIAANFAREGFECVAERHLGVSDNFAFSEVDAPTIERMVREAMAEAGPDAVTILCTNVAGAPLVERLERELGVPVYDSLAAAVWGALRAAGADPARVEGWGRLFREVG